MQQLDRLRQPRLASVLVLALAFLPGAAAADAWVDNGLQPVRGWDWVRVARPQPVQLLFEFQTNGAPNVRGTALLRRQVVETVRASGLFSQVSEAPVAGGAILHVVVDDLADEKARATAEGQGFADHSTFGLMGALVPEVYEARLDFIPGPGAPAITRSARHRIYGQIGLRAPEPENATRAASTWEAVLAMTREIVANPLNAIAGAPAFGAVQASGAATLVGGLEP